MGWYLSELITITLNMYIRNKKYVFTIIGAHIAKTVVTFIFKLMSTALLLSTSVVSLTSAF